jgi:hypothetical protein
MAKTSDIAETQARYSDAPFPLPTVDVEMDDQALTITDDLPYDAAISASELDAIERYMSDILDVVLGSGQAK